MTILRFHKIFAPLRIFMTFAVLLSFAVPVRAHHIQPSTCGLKSGSFARICRPSANTSCLSAVEREVAGYSQPFCEKRQKACSFCLALMMRCIGKIGHGPKSQYSCDECPAKFDRCIGKRYPVLPR